MTVQELYDKHIPLELSQGKGPAKAYCQGCIGPNKTLTIEWPCDAVKLLAGCGRLIDPQFRFWDKRIPL